MTADAIAQVITTLGIAALACAFMFERRLSRLERDVHANTKRLSEIHAWVKPAHLKEIEL